MLVCADARRREMEEATHHSDEGMGGGQKKPAGTDPAGFLEAMLPTVPQKPLERATEGRNIFLWRGNTAYVEHGGPPYR